MQCVPETHVGRWKNLLARIVATSLFLSIVSMQAIHPTFRQPFLHQCALCPDPAVTSVTYRSPETGETITVEYCAKHAETAPQVATSAELTSPGPKVIQWLFLLPLLVGPVGLAIPLVRRAVNTWVFVAQSVALFLTLVGNILYLLNWPTVGTVVMSIVLWLAGFATIIWVLAGYIVRSLDPAASSSDSDPFGDGPYHIPLR